MNKEEMLNFIKNGQIGVRINDVKEFDKIVDILVDNKVINVINPIILARIYYTIFDFKGSLFVSVSNRYISIVEDNKTFKHTISYNDFMTIYEGEKKRDEQTITKEEKVEINKDLKDSYKEITVQDFLESSKMVEKKEGKMTFKDSVYDIYTESGNIYYRKTAQMVNAFIITNDGTKFYVKKKPVEYVDFMTAVKSGKRFKWKEWNDFVVLDRVLLHLNHKRNSNIKEMLQDPNGWVIEEEE